MATLTFSATGLTARVKTISAGDVQRILAAYKLIYGTVSNGAGGQRPRTDQEVFDVFVDATFTNLVDAARQRERDVASAAIAPIVLT